MPKTFFSDKIVVVVVVVVGLGGGGEAYYLSPVIAIIRNAGRFLKLNQTTPLLTLPMRTLDGES